MNKHNKLEMSFENAVHLIVWIPLKMYIEGFANGFFVFICARYTNSAKHFAHNGFLWVCVIFGFMVGVLINGCAFK